MASDWTTWWVFEFVLYDWIWYELVFRSGDISIYSCMVCRLEKGVWLLNLPAELGILCLKQWQAVVYPVTLTSLMYAGSLVLKSIALLASWKEQCNDGEGQPSNCTENVLQRFIGKVFSIASNVSAWRNYFVVSIFTFLLLLINPPFSFYCPFLHAYVSR